MFLGLIMMVQVSGNVVVSVSLPNVKLLKIVTCYHLISFLLHSVLDLTGALLGILHVEVIVVSLAFHGNPLVFSAT
jgi:hypothetical protein